MEEVVESPVSRRQKKFLQWIAIQWKKDEEYINRIRKTIKEEQEAGRGYWW